MTKIKSYIGFAIKSKQIVFGTDNILKITKDYLVVASCELAENSIKKLQNKHNNTVILDKNSYDQLNLQFKAFLITDKNLAEAIKKCLASI